VFLLGVSFIFFSWDLFSRGGHRHAWAAVGSPEWDISHQSMNDGTQLASLGTTATYTESMRYLAIRSMGSLVFPTNKRRRWDEVLRIRQQTGDSFRQTGEAKKRVISMMDHITLAQPKETVWFVVPSTRVREASR
jgi:hypothetical protein